MSCEPGPKIAIKASWLPAFAASASALPASSGDANVFCTASVAAGFSVDLLHEPMEIIRATSANITQHREIMTLTRDISFLQRSYLIVDGQVFYAHQQMSNTCLLSYLRPPKLRPPPQTPPPPRLPHPRELAERSAQPPPPPDP